MNNSQVAHLWANKSKTSAKGSSFYFDGSTIYSYGGHFPIAKHVQISGEDWIIFNDSSYSSSTGRHQSLVRYAMITTMWDSRTLKVASTQMFNSICAEI